MMAGEARKAWKAVLHQLAVDVHALDPLVDVPGGLAHLVEGSRFHAIFVARPAGNGVHPDHRHEAVLEYPAIASAQTNIAWCQAPIPHGHVRPEHVARLDPMVIHTDQPHLIPLHSACSLTVPTDLRP